MMKLVSPTLLVNEQNKSAEVVNDSSFAGMPATAGTIGFSENVIRIIELARESDSCHFYTDGAWSMHQLLIGLMEITGPADIYLSSFAMSETAVRAICSLQDSGFIKSLRCVIDNRVETRSAGSLQLLKSISLQLRMRPCHAKATVIIGERCSMVIIGSANYTENKRMEVGFLDKRAETCSFHLQWIKKLLDEQ